MNVKNEDILLRNNTGNKSKNSLIEGFVVRTREFEQIFGEIKMSKYDKPEQHYLIVGHRGTGKTTLLYKLKYAIEDDPQLIQSVIPIMFPEEQYNISELVNLWESIAEHLEDSYGWTEIKNRFKAERYHVDNYEENIYYILEDAIRDRSKQIIVFIENINTLFKKIGEPGQQRLREILTTTKYIRIIGTSTSYFDGITDYSLPFYNFFKIIQLGGLNKKESIKLLLKIGEQYGAYNEIKTIIKEHPGRVESLRRLTGGIPRTISYLFQIFLDNENGKAIKDLYQLIDTLSLLYKSELDQLSAQQQKVIDVIARSWDAIAVKEIVNKTRYESKNVSSILSILQKNQIIETVPTKSKNNLYRLKERFMNIWYLMRFGRKHDKDNIIWLVRFFDAWCDETELAKRITLHMSNLKDGKYDVTAAIDMGNTFLSCENVSESLKYLLYTTTKSVLPEKLRKAVSVSNEVLMSKMNELIEKEEYPGAVSLLGELEGNTKNHYTVSHWLYLKMGKYEEAVEAANQLLELDPGNPFAAMSLGIVYEDYLFELEKAEHYFKIALEKKHPYAASRLGQIAFYHKHDLKSAVGYHRQAIKRGFKQSLLLLVEIWLKVGDVKQAEKISMEAVDAKVPEAYLKLGNVFFKKKLYKRAEEAYLKSVKLGESKSLANLGVLYNTRRVPDVEQAKSYFEKAIAAGIDRGYNLLGKLYLTKLKNQEMGIQTLYQGVEHKDPESAHSLAHFFETKGEYDKSDDLFIKSFEWGKHLSLLCLVDTIYMNGRKDKNQFALEILERNMNMVKSSFICGSLLYCKILLWNSKIENSVDNFKSSYSEIVSVLEGADNDFTDSNIKYMLDNVSEFILLLLAKEQYNICFSLFKDDSILDFKMLLKPIYYVMIENLKDDYPSEYLKAGDELKETIAEIKKHISYLKNNIV